MPAPYSSPTTSPSASEQKQALRESEARYRTAGEAIRYGVWVCNPEGGVEFVSQIFLDLIGKTLDEVKPRGWLDRLPPEDLKPTLEAWHAVRAHRFGVDLGAPGQRQGRRLSHHPQPGPAGAR